MFLRIVGLIIIAIFFASWANACEDPKEEIEVLALNIYHEARDQGYDGMLLVGEVTINRVESDSFPNDVCGVVYQRSQFSWNTQISNPEPQEEAAWELALEIAEDIYNYEIERFNNGATHFVNPSELNVTPRWVNVLERVGHYGDHVFYRE